MTEKPQIGRPPTKGTVGVKFTAQAEEIIKGRATTEGLDVPNYIRKHYWELIQEGLITPETEIRIPPPDTPNPYANVNQSTYQGNYSQPQTYPQGAYYQPPYQPYYPPYQQPHPPTPPNQFDSILEDLKKVYMTTVLQRLINGGGGVAEYMRAVNGGVQPEAPKKEFSMEDMIKWQTIQGMQDRQYQQQQQQYMQQLELARSKGDTKGENQALQLITALATSQAQQSQNNMQQIMAMMQMSNTTQQTLYQTSIQSANAAGDRQAQERQAYQQQLSQLQQQTTNIQLESLKTQAALQIEGLKTQMENIKNHKDPLTQLVELDQLRKDSPILDAAFKSVYGVKEGGIGDMIPKLKELGIDKVVDRITQALPGIAGSLMGGAGGQRAIPMPPPESEQQQPVIIQPPVIPSPMAPPTPEELRRLEATRLPSSPSSPSSTSTSTLESESAPDTVGYTNISVVKSSDVEAQVQDQPQQEQSIQVEESQQPQQPLKKLPKPPSP